MNVMPNHLIEILRIIKKYLNKQLIIFFNLNLQYITVYCFIRHVIKSITRFKFLGKINLRIQVQVNKLLDTRIKFLISKQKKINFIDYQ